METRFTPSVLLSSLVSSQQPAEVGSTPDDSTVQLSTSGEEDSHRGAAGSFRRCEQRLRSGSPVPRLTEDEAFPVNSALCGGAAFYIFGFNFSAFIEPQRWQVSSHPGHNAMTPLLSKTGREVDKPCYFFFYIYFYFIFFQQLTTHF